MSIYTIYRATNIINGKVYIGFDSKWPKRRSDHKQASKQDTNNKFYNAIRKYGWDNFTWEPIYQSMDYDHTLTIMEPTFITEYNSLEDGYNTDLGGTGGHLGAVWWNNGIKNSLSLIQPGQEYLRGRLPFKTIKGTSWWNNGVDQVMSEKQPDVDWRIGRIDLTQQAQSRYSPKSCHVCDNLIPFSRKNRRSCSAECATNHRKEVAAKPRPRVKQ